MRTPLLLPLLRSQAQGSLLATLYLHPEREYSLTDLAALIRVSVKTVHHEADRLAAAGFITSRRRGNLRLISADTAHRLARPLTDLLAAAYGPLPVLSELLAPVTGIEEAFIFGSWAARYNGQAGPVPADVDVLIVGTADLDELDSAALSARSQLAGTEVNMHRVGASEWNSDDPNPFLVQIRSNPLIQLGLPEDVHETVGSRAGRH